MRGAGRTLRAKARPYRDVRPVRCALRRALDAIEIGHKIARVDLRSGDAVIKLGAIVGTMTANAPRGAHVHLNNMESNYIPVHTRPTVSDGPTARSRPLVQHGGPAVSRGDSTEGTGDNVVGHRLGWKGGKVES